MDNLPLYIPIVFILTTLLTVILFYRAANNHKPTLLVLLGWLTIQAIVGLSGFYTVTDTLPPRFLALVLPPMLVLIGLFTTPTGRRYIDRLSLPALTILHTIRIPVEMVLFWLFLNGKIPELMTFEGRNFDILAGLSAPVIFYAGFVKKRLGNKALLVWNIICLGLLANIVGNAVLSAPSPFQQFAFEQPNVAILYFPFNLLPGCVVPLVLIAHLAAIRQLWNGKATS